MIPLDDAPRSLLGRWYGEPMDEDTARQLLATAEHRRRKRLLARRPCRLCPLLEMVARFWLGYEVEDDYRILAERAGTRRARALLELVYGQLLTARRLRRGIEHLQRGFEIAAPLFAPHDYFTVMKRHALLRRLPLTTGPAPAAQLDDLLTTARVIERLEGSSPPSLHSNKATDTCG